MTTPGRDLYQRLVKEHKIEGVIFQVQVLLF